MLYIDSADVRAIEGLMATGLFAGTTSNPGILERDGRTFAELPEIYERAVAAGAEHVFAQATGLDVAALHESARTVIGLGERARVKLMCTSAGLQVAADLAREGHEVLVTGITHPAQVLAARAADARWVAAYVSRAARAGVGPERLIGEATRAMAASQADNPTLRIVAASLHSLDEVSAAAAWGAIDMTLPPDICRALLDDEATTATAQAFEASHAGTPATPAGSAQPAPEASAPAAPVAS